MKKVMQSRYGKEEGNCYQACLASVLGLPLESVPDFCNLYKDRPWQWQQEANKWLRRFGLATLTVAADCKDSAISEMLKDCYVIATGDNCDGVRHCVIYRNGKPVHNPNKYCKGIVPDSIDLIFPLDVECGIIAPHASLQSKQPGGE